MFILDHYFSGSWTNEKNPCSDRKDWGRSCARNPDVCLDFTSRFYSPIDL